MSRQSKLAIVITAVAFLGIAVHRLVPSLQPDAVTLGLLVLAIVPWLTPLIKSIEVPGVGKLELQDVKNEIAAVRKQVEQSRLVQEAFRDAVFFRQHRRYAEAEAAYQKVLYHEPASVEARIGVAVVKSYASPENLSMAIQLLDDVLAEQPESAKALYNRACFRLVKRDPAAKQQWLDDLRRAIKLDPTYRLYAIKDEDFANVQEDAEFKQVIRS